MIAPTGPYGHVLRPSDGKEPNSIAYVQCAGSRDTTLGRGILLTSVLYVRHQTSDAAFWCAAFWLTSRSTTWTSARFGKGYEQFYQNAKAMGEMDFR